MARMYYACSQCRKHQSCIAIPSPHMTAMDRSALTSSNTAQYKQNRFTVLDRHLSLLQIPPT